MERRPSSLRDTLEDDIVTGRYSPGEHLDEVSLAERFGVSRTPIREALQQLAATGLIELRRHRGAIVAEPDPSRLVEMFEVMAELEALCGRLAAQRLSAEEEMAIRTATLACRRAVGTADTDAYYYENERFHRAIYGASGNGFLAEQALLLHRRLAPFRRLQLRVRNRMHISQSEHEEILEAIAAHDADAAAARLRAHVSAQSEWFRDLLDSLHHARSAVG